MLTPNQITDTFQSQIGRAPTDFEIGKYGSSSIQDLANLKSTYGKLNTTNSISDYLTSTGQDSSLSNRLKLYQQYGITPDTTGNYYKSNIALLNALRTGAKPGAAPAPAVGGTITPSAPQPQNGTALGNGTTPSVGGSISDATTQNGNQVQPTETPTETPTQTGTEKPAQDAPSDISVAKDAYTSAQKSVLNITKQIDDINQAINSAMKNKREEIARSGGIVDESQLRSTVLAENAPLLAERNQLASQRTQLVGEQNIAGKAYQDAINVSKQADANYFKQAQLDLNKEKVGIQSAQFEEKLAQSGWKSTKINITDAAGNVLGQKVVWTQNPGSATTKMSNSAQYTPTSSGSGGISSKGVTNVGNTQELPKITLADGASPGQVLQSLISGPAVPVKGSTTPLSQQTLYNAAIDSMLGIPSSAGSRIPAGAAIAVQNKKTDIMNAYGLTEFDVNAAREQMKGITAANTQLMSTAAFTKTYGTTATDNLDLALQESALVPRGGAAILNKYKQWVSGNFTPDGPLAKLQTYIYTAAREYAKVTSGGAKSAAGLTDSAAAEAEKLINASQSPEVFAQVVQAMKGDMSNVINNFDKQTSSFPDSVKKLYGLASNGAGGSQVFAPRSDKSDIGAHQFVASTFAAMYPGETEDSLNKKYASTLQKGEQLAFDNKTGAIVAYDPSKDDPSEYTPI